MLMNRRTTTTHNNPNATSTTNATTNLNSNNSYVPQAQRQPPSKGGWMATTMMMTSTTTNRNHHQNVRLIIVGIVTTIGVILLLVIIWIYFLFDIIHLESDDMNGTSSSSNNNLKNSMNHKNQNRFFQTFVNTRDVIAFTQQQHVQEQPQAKNDINRFCQFRNYPSHRYYGLPTIRNNTALDYSFLLSDTEYIHGVWPIVLSSSSSSTKICVNQTSWLYDKSRRGMATYKKLNEYHYWPFADGTNPSILLMHRLSSTSLIKQRILQYHPNAYYIVTVCMTNSQCTWNDHENKNHDNVYDIPDLQQREPDTVRTIIMLLDKSFHKLIETTIELIINAPYGIDTRKRSMIQPKQTNLKTSDIEKFNTKLLALDDARLFVHKDQIYVSYREGPTFGYDVQVINPIHIQFHNNQMTAKVYASETISFCCGRNMALLEHPHDTMKILYSLTWVDPVTMIVVDTDHTVIHDPTTILFLPPDDNTNDARTTTATGQELQKQKRRNMISSNREQEQLGNNHSNIDHFHHSYNNTNDNNRKKHKIVYVPNPKPPQHTPLKEEIHQHHIHKKKEIQQKLKLKQRKVVNQRRRLSLSSSSSLFLLSFQHHDDDDDDSHDNNTRTRQIIVESYREEGANRGEEEEEDMKEVGIVKYDSQLRHNQYSYDQRRLAAIEVQNPKHKSHIHGTNGFMVPLSDIEFLGVAHFHRPNDRNKNPFARFGHHYTHAFYIVRTNHTPAGASATQQQEQQSVVVTGELIQLGIEFVLPSYYHKNDGHIIQFLSGLEYSHETDEVIISYGINDCEAAIMRLSYSNDIQPLLKAVPSGQEVIHFMKKVVQIK